MLRGMMRIVGFGSMIMTILVSRMVLLIMFVVMCFSGWGRFF